MTSSRVLLLFSDDESLRDTAARLADDGFDVVRCNEPGTPAFPCVGVSGGTCPLELSGGVDVVVDVRQHPWPNPTLREMGVTCALRAHVPVVVVSDAPHPFEGRADTVAPTASLAEACEDAIAASLEELRAAVAEAAGAVLAGHGLADRPFAVDADRQQARLWVRVAVDAPADVRGMVATRAAVAARRYDRAARTLEIDVVSPAR